jgi:hypothetical protein
LARLEAFFLIILPGVAESLGLETPLGVKIARTTAKPPSA